MFFERVLTVSFVSLFFFYFLFFSTNVGARISKNAYREAHLSAESSSKIINAGFIYLFIYPTDESSVNFHKIVFRTINSHRYGGREAPYREWNSRCVEK